MQAILMLAALGTLPAHASLSPRVVKLPQRSWYCMANGHDERGQRHSVSGRNKSTRDEAARDAIRNCQNLFMGCQAGTCIQE